jgi:hypothetical protein
MFDNCGQLLSEHADEDDCGLLCAGCAHYVNDHALCHCTVAARALAKVRSAKIKAGM